MEREGSPTHQRVQEFINKIPETGIGIHGTTLDNARVIAKEGIRLDLSKKTRLIYYQTIFPFRLGAGRPNRRDSNSRSGQFALIQSTFIEAGMNWAYYLDPRVTDESLPSQDLNALVVFLPPNEGQLISGLGLSAGVTSKISIPSENIMGIIELPIAPPRRNKNRNNRDTRKVSKDFIKILSNYFSSQEQTQPVQE